MKLLRPSLLAVDILRILEPFFGDFHRVRASSHRAEKARLITFVTRRADLLHLDQQSIAIAIKRDVFYRLQMPAGFAFHPELLARAAPKMRFAGFNRLFDGSPIHPG